ncbi:Gfo/Idh/MocA family protein [Microbacterium pygmaeum]|uniref:Predicted dehydrogenase n=1 Tax=Microbacterium pygmaeum TaxID=370764 RepID=A0A1G7YML4_9MICO|nr:Gfo/Idh/MocA family oxidoreductase [Microbacterium pygmaeum]SDG97634.1 Predicted dehydrogenase [Microbacterium pygmaeum]
MTRRTTPLGVALVGAGFMGGRHLLGYAALDAAGYDRITVAAIVDVNPETATARALEVEQLLGNRPAVYTRLEDAFADAAVEAVDIVTDPRTHHTIAAQAFDAGRHVICEKPLALTVSTGRSMVVAAERAGLVLATAENYRRGGSNRLAKAVIDSGALGELFLFREVRVGGDDRVIISPWRHMKRSGSIGLDMSIHYADIIEYLLGPVHTVWGRGFIAEPQRVPAGGGTPIIADGEDSLVVAMRTESGVDVHLAYIPSGRGLAYGERVLHGRNGSLVIPADRTDGDVVLHLADGTRRGAEIADLLGEDFALDAITRAVLGEDGTGGKGAPWAGVDAGHLAIELADFADAVLDGRPPEVDGVGGLRALAIVHAAFESGVLDRAVSVDEVLEGSLHAYQDDIDAQFTEVA